MTMVIQPPPPILPFYVLPPLQAPTPAGLAQEPVALAFNAALAGLEETVGDTTLLQAEYPAPVVDTTLLQAEINLGMAVMTEFQGGVSPAPSPFYPRPEVPLPLTDMAEVLAEPLLPREQPLPLPAATNPEPEAPPRTGSPSDLGTLALAESNLAEATLLNALQPVPVAGSTLLQQEVAANEAAAATEPRAEDLAAQAVANEEEQRAFLAVLQAGVANVPLLAGGPSQGIATTLAGAGWVHVPDATNAAEAATLWAFHLPFRATEVPAVTSSGTAEPADARRKPQKSGEPLTTYSARGAQTPPLDAAEGSTLDILD